MKTTEGIGKTGGIDRDSFVSGESTVIERTGTFLGLMLVLAIAFLVLPGCATVSAANQKIQADVAKVEDKIAGDAQAVSAPDLENAKLGAQTLPEPTRTDFLTCFNEQESYLASVKTATSAALAAVNQPAGAGAFNPLQFGLATGAVNAQTVSSSIGDAGSLFKTLLAAIPPVPHQLEKDCAIVYQDTRLAVAKIGLSAGALAAQLAAGAKVQAGADALKAEAAALKTAKP